MKLLRLGIVALALGAAQAAVGPSTLAAQAAPAPSTRVEGVYDLVVTESSSGPTALTLTIVREGETLKASTAPAGDLAIVGVTVQGEEVVLLASYQGSDAFPLPGRFTETGMAGQWSVEGFGGPWVATRKGS